MTNGVMLKRIVVRTWRESLEDDVFGNAAKLAYYFLLSLFPLLIFLTSLIGFLPGVQVSLLDGLARAAPPEATALVRDTLADVVSHRSGGLLSLGLVGSLWSASTGVASLIDALNRANGDEGKRPFWKRRLKAVMLTLVTVLFLAGGSLLVMIGDMLGAWLERSFQIGAALALISTILGYFTGFAFLLIGIGALYYFGPDSNRTRVKSGALFAASGIVIGSLLFSLYVRVGPAASATYGSLGAVVTLMLWLYLVGLMLLVGAEINSEAA